MCASPEFAMAFTTASQPPRHFLGSGRPRDALNSNRFGLKKRLWRRWANSTERDPNIEFPPRHRRRPRDKRQLILAIGNFDTATFWQRRPAFEAFAAFAYGQGVCGVK
jgi:hypothetical protein